MANPSQTRNHSALTAYRQTLKEKSIEISTQHGKSMDFLLQYVEIGSSDAMEDAIYKAISSKPKAKEPASARITIFYAEQVFVFDDFSANKVREVMLLAGKGSSPNSTDFSSTSSVASGSSTLPNFGSNPTQERLPSQTQATNSDLPIARRALLHRFFEKRKDRVIARAPYQLHNPSPAFPRAPYQLHNPYPASCARAETPTVVADKP